MWVALLDETPVKDDIIDQDKIKPFHTHLLSNKGAFAVCWTVEQVLQFIYNSPGDYITPEKYLDVGCAKY